MADEMTFRQQVAARAAYQCEYCRLSERYTSVPFQVDHVIAEKHQGKTSLENLAYVCCTATLSRVPTSQAGTP